MLKTANESNQEHMYRVKTKCCVHKYVKPKDTHAHFLQFLSHRLLTRHFMYGPENKYPLYPNPAPNYSWIDGCKHERINIHICSIKLGCKCKQKHGHEYEIASLLRSHICTRKTAMTWFFSPRGWRVRVTFCWQPGSTTGTWRWSCACCASPVYLPSPPGMGL